MSCMIFVSFSCFSCFRDNISFSQSLVFSISTEYLIVFIKCRTRRLEMKYSLEKLKYNLKLNIIDLVF